jgi:hypothetical protein
VGALAVGAVLLASGCGGGKKQTADEPARTYKLETIALSFAPHQAVSKPASMRIEVRNPGTRTIPNVAVTLDSFSYVEKYPELAANKRPVWVVEQGPGTPPQKPVESQAVSPPGGGQTAYVNTWALGPLAPHKTRVFEWKVVPVKAGTHSVSIEIAAGLGGQAKATLPDGRPVKASFRAEIAPLPPLTHVDPNTGKVVPGGIPAHS